MYFWVEYYFIPYLLFTLLLDKLLFIRPVGQGNTHDMSTSCHRLSAISNRGIDHTQIFLSSSGDFYYIQNVFLLQKIKYAINEMKIGWWIHQSTCMPWRCQRKRMSHTGCDSFLFTSQRGSMLFGGYLVSWTLVQAKQNYLKQNALVSITP